LPRPLGEALAGDFFAAFPGEKKNVKITNYIY
jgi:hypothetical protein